MASPRTYGLLLLTTAPVAFAQRFSDSPKFIGNDYDIAEIAIWGIIFMSFLTLCFMAFINLITVRRRPYTFALLSSFLLTISSAASVTILVLSNIFPLDTPTHLPSSLSGIGGFLSVWGRLLIFVTVVVAMHDRLAALDTASGNQPTAEDINRRRIFWALHGFFVLLIFTLGTASIGVLTSLLHDYESDRIISSAEIRRRGNIFDDLSYAYESFFVFAVFDVVALAIYLRGRIQKITAKDQVSNVLVYVVTPTYIFLTLIMMIFVIIFSPAGITRTELNYARAGIASDILFGVSVVGVLGPLLSLGFSKLKWATPGENHAPAFVQYGVAQQPYNPQQIYYAQQPIYSPPQWPIQSHGQLAFIPGQQQVPVQESFVQAQR